MTTDPPARPVIWTERALNELEAIRAYIGAVKPLAAQRMAARLIAAAEDLAEYPARYRTAGAVRELVVIRPYIIRYRITANSVVILRIRHGARRPLK
jgi:plasmid stabilization system protein ParE